MIPAKSHYSIVIGFSLRPAKLGGITDLLFPASALSLSCAFFAAANIALATTSFIIALLTTKQEYILGKLANVESRMTKDQGHQRLTISAIFKRRKDNFQF